MLCKCDRCYSIEETNKVNVGGNEINVCGKCSVARAMDVCVVCGKKLNGYDVNGRCIECAQMTATLMQLHDSDDSMYLTDEYFDAKGRADEKSYERFVTESVTTKITSKEEALKRSLEVKIWALIKMSEAGFAKDESGRSADDLVPKFVYLFNNNIDKLTGVKTRFGVVGFTEFKEADVVCQKDEAVIYLDRR